ncbi:MAG TPA: uridine kinase [Thermoanaerobaculia bacterium]|nr:uridine kinase [Thermoanaerobaculia bacterium]
MKTPVMIGIAGGTGSGKTTVAQGVYDRVGKDRIEWISHDSYYRNFDGYSPEDRRKINFDHPDSLETELLARHLDVLAKGSSVEVPVYDFTTFSRRPETQRVEPRKVIIVEGILVLAEPELRKRINIKLFVDTPADIRFVRRLTRDTKVRGRSLESVIEQYMNTVRPMHEEFVEPSKRYADLIIPEGGENQVALDAIISRIEHLLTF